MGVQMSLPLLPSALCPLPSRWQSALAQVTVSGWPAGDPLHVPEVKLSKPSPSSTAAQHKVPA